MLISVFARRLAPYSVSFLRALANRGHQVELFFQPTTSEAPYDGFDLSFCHAAFADLDGSHRRRWLQRSDAELPDAALIAGWTSSLERAIGHRLRRLERPVACGMDNPWKGSLRQYLGCFIAPWYLRPVANIAWVAGEPQAEFARRLGFPIVELGYYCADVEAYACKTPLAERSPAVLFTGRLVVEKGLDLLIAAYQQYRQQVSDPLELWLAGTGPMAALAEGEPGVQALGFVQPSALPSLMARVQALVLPSRIEPWGVVIHEAAAAGLPVLASNHCHAATAFVRDGISGFIYEASTQGILQALLRFHLTSATERQTMSEQSHNLALTWTPQKQALAFERAVLGN